MLFVFHGFGKDALQFVASQVEAQLAPHGEADGSCLFADNDGNGIGLLGDAEGSTMAQAEVFGDVERVADGQDAASRRNASVADDHGSVVKGGVLEEDVLDEFGIDAGINGFARLDDVGKGHFALQNDECADKILRHVVARHDDGQQGGVFGFFGRVFGEEADEVAQSALAADGEEETADFFLEDDEQSEGSDADEFVEDAAEEFHLEYLGNDNPDDDEDEDAVEDVERSG